MTILFYVEGVERGNLHSNSRPAIMTVKIMNKIMNKKLKGREAVNAVLDSTTTVP